MYDVIIVGGGPAGLSAALVLGRSRRAVLLCDAGKQRNLWSDHMHGFLTRDGMPPCDFLEAARAELVPYGVEQRRVMVKGACKTDDHFTVTLVDGGELKSRRLLLATGVSDHIPKIAGIDELYGKSVHHCPYCDGWENRDRRIAVYGKQNKGVGLALSMLTWSSDIVVCTDGPARMSARVREQLKRHGIAIRKERIIRLEGDGSQLTKIVFERGDALDRDALFFNTGQNQACDLAQNFGCLFNHKGTVETNRFEGTNIPGLFVAGDASRDVQLVIVAAAEGAKAAIAINTSLQKEDVK